MIKKIVWTLILIAPGILTLIMGFLPIEIINNSGMSNLDQAFNYSGAINGWIKFFKDLVVVIQSNGNIPFHEVLLPLFIAIFWTAPFWYAWKGTFFLKVLPIRIIFLLLIFFMPQIIKGVSLFTTNDSWKPETIYYTNLLLIAISLIGLWLKS